MMQSRTVPYLPCLGLILLLDLAVADLGGDQKLALAGATESSSSFRLGSGAVAVVTSDTTQSYLTESVEANRLKPTQSLMSTKNPYLDITPGKYYEPKPKHKLLEKFVQYNPYLLGAALLSVMIYMMPTLSRESERSFNYRVPPAWSPEDQNYSFRAFMTDISLWIMLTDLQPHQQCAAIVMRLGGGAREMARMITPQEMMNGGILNGVAVDPVTYLLGSLHAKFSALEEESRLTAMTEMLAFARRPG